MSAKQTGGAGFGGDSDAGRGEGISHGPRTQDGLGRFPLVDHPPLLLVGVRELVREDSAPHGDEPELPRVPARAAQHSAAPHTSAPAGASWIDDREARAASAAAPDGRRDALELLVHLVALRVSVWTHPGPPSLRLHASVFVKTESARQGRRRRKWHGAKGKRSPPASGARARAPRDAVAPQERPRRRRRRR